MEHKHSKKRCTQSSHLSSQELSDEDFVHCRLEQSSQFSSSHASNYREVTSDHVSMEFLKNDDWIQQKVVAIIII